MAETDGAGGGIEASTVSTSRVVRATSDSSRAQPARPQSPTERHNPAVITAELPAYRPAPTTGVAQRSQYADPRPHGRSRRRDPAPILLRIFVWVLAFLALIAVAAAVTEHVQSSWLEFLRNTHVSAAPAANQSASKTITVSSRNGSTITYNVPAAGFTILVLPVDHSLVVVKSPPDASSSLYVQNLTRPASGKPFGVVYVKKPASVVLSRAADEIAIDSGSTHLGTVESPKVGTTYIFNPKG